MWATRLVGASLAVALGCALFAPTTASADDVAAPDAGAQPAVHATRLPPGFVLRYDLQRGFVSGTGELAWRPAAPDYEASLQLRVAGVSVLSWVSSGRLGPAGVQPSRYVERRLGKAARTASFSAAEGGEPLAAGGQDRLSWIIQLPALLAADPAKTKTGTRLGFWVANARGRVEVWEFRVHGTELVRTAAGTVPAVKWSRQTHEPRDTQVEVWLDPQRQFLPVRVRIGAGEDAPLEMSLSEAAR